MLSHPDVNGPSNGYTTSGLQYRVVSVLMPLLEANKYHHYSPIVVLHVNEQQTRLFSRLSLASIRVISLF